MDKIAFAEEFLLSAAMVILAGAMLLTLIRAMIGPRFTDRILAVNMISTQTIMLICLLAFLIGEQYLVDVALVFAMISFMAVVSLANLYLSRIRARKMAAEDEAKADKAGKTAAGPVRNEREEGGSAAEEAGAEDVL